MTQKQRLLIKRELNELRKRFLLERDPKRQSILEREIAVLEAQLKAAPQTEPSKSSVHISDVDAGRDITIGDHINHHHHYAPLSDKPSSASSPRKKWLLFLFVPLIIVGFLLAWKAYFPIENAAKNTEIPIIKPGDEAGNIPLKKIETSVLEQGDSAQTLPVEKEVPNQLSSPNNRNAAIKTFKVTSVSKHAADLLKMALEEKKIWKKSKGVTADLSIEITYSGTPVEIKDRYYRYPKGFVQIKINDEICCCEDFLKIDLQGSKYGNLLPRVEQQLKKHIDELLTQHLDDVIEKIKECAS